MDATIEIKINPREALPANQHERVAWLERYGLPPAETTLKVTMPLGDWIACGCQIDENGRVFARTFSDQSDAAYTATVALFEREAIEYVRRTGKTPPVESAAAEDMAYIISRVIEQRRATVAAEMAERAARDAEVARLMAMPLETFLSDPATRKSPAYDHAFSRRYAERIKREQRLAVEQEQRADADARARQQHIRAWLVEHDRNSMRKRYDDGLLPEDEFWRALADEIFAPLADFPLYRKMSDADVHPDCQSSIRFWSQKATELDAADYAVFERIRAAAPKGAAFALKEHVGACSCDGVSQRVRYGVTVSIEWHGRELRREYALDLS